jgi:aconitate hydratase 2/2-methylisocitrate dehydratase
MDESQLKKEGSYDVFNRLTDHTELPGCSLCMGNQARVAEGSTVVSTSTRNFPNRLGDGANVYLASAEIAAVSAKLGYIPTMEEYLEAMQEVKSNESSVYQYLNFHQLDDYKDELKNVPLETILG